jgi:type IV secretion system protein VirD4
MLAAISRRKRAPTQPTLFLIDEAAQLGEMNDLRAALTLMRAYGMRVWLLWQDLAQLQNTYRDWESIINNCKVQQFFGARAPQAKRSLNVYLGDTLPKTGLDADEQVLFDGTTLSTVRRASYLTDPMLQNLASPHPFHLPAEVRRMH